MSKQTEMKERISALIDGESEDLARDVDMLLADEAAKAEWERAHFVRDLTKGGVELKASSGFAGSVMAALESEPTVLAPKSARAVAAASKPATVSWLRPVAGLAIAATVAAVTVIGFDAFKTPVGGEISVPQVAHVTSQQQNGLVIAPVKFTGAHVTDRTYWQGSDEAMQNDLNMYLANHTEHAESGSFQGMLPYVRLAGFDGESQ